MLPTKIEKLTPKQKAKIPIYLKRYFDKVYHAQPINKKLCEDSICYIYEKFGYKKPFIWYVESPLMAQIIVNILTDKDKLDNLVDNLRDNLVVNLGDNLRANLGDNLVANLWANLRDNLGDNLGANLGANLWANLWANLGANLRANLRANLGANLVANLGKLNYITTSYYGNISDFGWTCFYDFINTELIPSYELELWTKWKQLIDSNVYDTIQMDGLCVVMSMPKIVHINENKRLHCENGPCVEWKDGYKGYAWNGIIVPDFWITNKEKLTKEIIINEKNAEKRRCIQEILGGEFIKKLDVELIDSDKEDELPIELYRTKQPDDNINEHIYYLKVVCPSTNREYFLCVPESKNVWEAKAWTFQNQKIEIRHGDVGLLNLSQKFDKPIFQS